MIATSLRTGALLLASFGGVGCSVQQPSVKPSIEFTQIPEAGPGGDKHMAPIAGRVTGARPGQKIVLYAKSGTWWVQPFSKKPLTEIQRDSSWKSSTHSGSEYAALLVSDGYVPPAKADVLPAKDDSVLAVAVVEGRGAVESSKLTPKRIRFSGYEWEARQIPSNSGGVMHLNSGSNAWTDANGWLHLRITREGDAWTCAEVGLLRSLGYGTYSFVVRDMPRLEPATVLGMFTWDDLESGQNHREIDIELSQWGDPEVKNAQFVIQPYYVPANSFRFMASSAPSTHSFHWEPGRVSFKSTQHKVARVVAEHVFTSGVPSPGAESIHMKLYVYGKSRTPQRHGVEVVIEKFEFLP